eukprot:152162_1
MKQLHYIIEIKPQFNIHSLIKQTILLLIKDSLKIYSSIQLILWQLICSLQKLTIKQAIWISNTYNQYFQLNQKYKLWFTNIVKLGIINHQYTPKFNTLPKSLADKLKKYINSYHSNSDSNSHSDSSSNSKPTKKTKKQKKKKKKKRN